MIAAYEAKERPALLSSPRQYALSQMHKHLPEMQKVCGLDFTPILNPIVADFYSGMVVSVPLHARLLPGNPGIAKVHGALAGHYQGAKLIKVLPLGAEEGESGYLAANALSGRDDMEILVAGNDERILITARFDNLGKGASGAAVQCLNLMLGDEEYMGLHC